jgi:hypothetical protein
MIWGIKASTPTARLALPGPLSVHAQLVATLRTKRSAKGETGRGPFLSTTHIDRSHERAVQCRDDDNHMCCVQGHAAQQFLPPTPVLVGFFISC